MTTTDGSAAAAAWQGLLDRLAEAGAVVTGPLGAQDERERAEGFRHLTRVASVAFEMLVEKGDRQRPGLTRWMNEHRKVFGDNPGTIYDAAVIDPTLTYRLHGTRGTTTYLGVCVYGTNPDTGARRIAGNVDDTDLTIGADGAFDLWLGPAGMDAPEGADRLVLDADVTDLMVRQYRHDLDREVPGAYVLTPVPDPGPPPHLDEPTIAARLDEAGRWIADTVAIEATLSALVTSMTPGLLRGGRDFIDAEGRAAPPPIDPEVVAKVMPSAAIQYAGTWFDDLGDDEAIVVTGVPPRARYWSVQLLTRWMESGDWVHHQVFLTDRDVVLEPDGSLRIVVSHLDPGHPNWLQTTGLRSANVAMRALGAPDVMDITFERRPFEPPGPLPTG